MAEQISDKRVAEFKEAFSVFDKDGDGEITAKEIGDVMRSLGQDPTDAELQDMLDEIDLDKSGTISFDEFLTIMMLKTEEVDIHQELRQAFKVFDQDDSGSISKDELRNVLASLGEELTAEDINDIIDEADKDGDGVIDFNEFVELMTAK